MADPIIAQITKHPFEVTYVWASYQIRIIWLRMRQERRELFPATAGMRSRHAARHVRDARAVMHARIAN